MGNGKINIKKKTSRGATGPLKWNVKLQPKLNISIRVIFFFSYRRAETQITTLRGWVGGMEGGGGWRELPPFIITVRDY